MRIVHKLHHLSADPRAAEGTSFVDENNAAAGAAPATTGMPASPYRESPWFLYHSIIEWWLR